jgi:hypothetical protein
VIDVPFGGALSDDQRVAEITETEYFQRLHGQADQLRRSIDGQGDP